MSHWENVGKSNEWYTPEYIFNALECKFDLDVAHPDKKTNVPCLHWISKNSLSSEWDGFIWMNSPFEGRNGLTPWLDKFFYHGNGICLTPDRTSVTWWQDAKKKSDAVLYVHGKIKFIDGDGREGKSPSNGTTLFACGDKGVEALLNAQKNGLGSCDILNKRMWIKHNIINQLEDK